MEPVIINPSNQENQEEPKNEPEQAVADTAEVKRTEIDTVIESTQSSSEAIVTPEDHHKEVLPSLAIPAETIGTKTGKKKKLLPVVFAVAVLVAGVFGALQLFGKDDTKTLVADPAVQQIDHLRVGTTYAPLNKVYPDPNFVGGGSWAVTTQMYEGLVGFANGDTITPLLAESWTNPDTKTWVFKLKDSVSFHNGKPLTAEDVKSSIDKALADPNTIPLLISSIDKVTVLDDQRIEITTKEPDAILLNKLLFLYIQGEEKLNGLPVGTGAYRVADGFDGATGENEMQLEVFNQYHGGKPAVQKVTFLAFEDDTAMVEAVKDNKIDISDLLLEAGKEYANINGFSRVEQPDGFIFYIAINTNDRRSPLAKLQVRQALQLSLDSRLYLDNLNIPGAPASQISMALNFGFDPNLEPTVRDVAKAKQLLKEAGYPNGVSIKLSFADSEATRKEFEELKEQAAEASITLVPDIAKDYDTHFDNISAGKTQAYRLGSASAFIDTYDLLAFNFQNDNYSNPAFDDLLTKSNAEFNATERKKLLQEASKILLNDVAAIPLYESRGTFYVNNTLNYKQTLGFALPGDYVKNITKK